MKSLWLIIYHNKNAFTFTLKKQNESCIRLIVINIHLNTSNATEQRKSRENKKKKHNEMSHDSKVNGFSVAIMEV